MLESSEIGNIVYSSHNVGDCIRGRPGNGESASFTPSFPFPAVIAPSQPGFNQPFPKTHAIGTHIRIQSKALSAIPAAASA